MKRLVLALATLLSFNAAFAAKACEELKSEIAARIDAAGVKGYTLDIVDNDKVADAKVVGSCDGGSKKIVYAKKPAQ